MPNNHTNNYQSKSGVNSIGPYQYDVYISYSSKDSDWVKKDLLPRLEASNIEVFDIKDYVGGNRAQAIEAGVKSSRKALIILSKSYISEGDEWDEYEVALFQYIDPVGRDRRIIPLLREECDVPPRISHLVEVDFSDPNEIDQSWRLLINALKPNIADIFEAHSLDSVIAKLKIDFSKPMTKPNVNTVIRTVKSIVEDLNDYPLAQLVAKEYRAKVEDYGDIPKLALLDVWYAHALMYTGDTAKAREILERITNDVEKKPPSESDDDYATWCEAIGRTHNHIGYMHWVDFGSLERAGEEFIAAIGYFLRSKIGLVSEIATAYDNFGRVCSQLGYSTYAEIIIDNGRQLRVKDEARLPLSLDSMAVAYLDAGQPNRALNFSKEALFLFQEYYKKTKQGSRRIGLALLTQGRALRRLGSLDYTSEINQTKSFKENLDLLEKAEDVLVAAKDKFELAQEKLRLFQVCNELACVAREQAKIFKNMGKDDESHQLTENVEEHIRESLQYLVDNISTADLESNRDEKIEMYIKNIFICLATVRSEDEWKYRLYILDSCEDLARAWFLTGGHLSRIENLIETALSNIPQKYDIKDPNFSKASIETYTEEYWQQIGKLYALWGEMYFKSDRHKAIENYVLATAYFGLFRKRNEKTGQHIFPAFKPELASHRALVIKIYNDLKFLSREDLNVLREKDLASFEKENPQFSTTWYQDFKDILELACLVNDS